MSPADGHPFPFDKPFDVPPHKVTPSVELEDMILKGRLPLTLMRLMEISQGVFPTFVFQQAFCLIVI